VIQIFKCENKLVETRQIHDKLPKCRSLCFLWVTRCDCIRNIAASRHMVWLDTKCYEPCVIMCLITRLSVPLELLEPYDWIWQTPKGCQFVIRISLLSKKHFDTTHVMTDSLYTVAASKCQQTVQNVIWYSKKCQFDARIDLESENVLGIQYIVSRT
jgi:hypothetical protein